MRSSAARLHVVAKLEYTTIEALLAGAPNHTLTYARIRAALPDYKSIDVIKLLVEMRHKRWIILHDDWRQLNEMRVSLPF